MTTPAAPLCRCGKEEWIPAGLRGRALEVCKSCGTVRPSAGETREAEPVNMPNCPRCGSIPCICHDKHEKAAEPAGGQEPPDPAKYADDAYGNRMLRRDLAEWKAAWRREMRHRYLDARGPSR